MKEDVVYVYVYGGYFRERLAYIAMHTVLFKLKAALFFSSLAIYHFIKCFTLYKLHIYTVEIFSC